MRRLWCGMAALLPSMSPTIYREKGIFLVPDRSLSWFWFFPLAPFLVVVDVRSELTHERGGRQDEDEGGVWWKGVLVHTRTMVSDGWSAREREDN